jgi:dTDP-4-amino-4,6-dideoxygalactose transaminase
MDGVRAIPYVDLKSQHAPLREALLEAVGEVIDSGDFVLGRHVERFEEQFAGIAGVRHAIGVNSGTDALILALHALGIGQGDEVVTAPNTFVSTVSAIRLVGATPVLADVGEDGNLDPACVAAAVTARTRAVLPVHLTGRPCDMDGLRAAAGDGVAVVEDAAQAVGASWRGRPAGSLGTIGCFSLHPLKNLNALGDGGVVTTDDDAIAENVRLRRNLGLRTREDAVLWASNSRLDTVQAAMLLVKLRELDVVTTKRRDHAARYASGLQEAQCIKWIPTDDDARRSVYHTFVVRARDRDGLREHLRGAGIGSAVHYPTPIHLMTVARELGRPAGSFPVAERHAREILSLPVHQGLAAEDIDAVCAAIRAFRPRPDTRPEHP